MNTKKSLLISLVLVVGLLFAMLPSGKVEAATLCVGGGAGCYSTIPDALTAASNSDIITVEAGEYSISSTIIVNKEVTITGPSIGVAKLIGSGVTAADLSIFKIIASNVTIQNLEITHTGIPLFGAFAWVELDWSLIQIPTGSGLTGISILNNKIYVPAQPVGAMGTWGGIAMTVGSGTVAGINISGNTIYNTRNGIVIHYNNSATLNNNIIYNTKGGIMNYTSAQIDADARVMINNSWSTVHNEWDMVWNSGGGPYDMDMNKSVLLVSQANNGAYVVSKMTTLPVPNDLTGNRSHIFVNASSTLLTKNWGAGNMNQPFGTIQLGVDAVVPGGTVYVAAGTYVEQVNINKRVSIIGAGKDGANATIITSNALGTVLLGATGTFDSPILLKDLQVTGAWGVRTSITPIDYFTMDNVWLNANPVKSGEGFRVNIGHQLTHLTITNSIIEGYIDGVIIEKTPGTGDLGTKLQYVTVTDTIFRNNYRKGLYVETLSDAIFTNVQLVGNGYVNPGTNLAEYNSAGFDINLKDGAYRNLQFINMTATGNGLKAKDGAALMIKARSDGTTYSVYPATLDNVLISGGSFTGNERGIRIGEPNKNNVGPTNVVITGASLYGNVKTYTGTDGSAYGDVVNYSLAPVDATGNWWGFASGPAAGQTYGSVAYCGWLNAAPPSGVAVAKPVINTNTLEGFCTIQAAIDDAQTLNGHTITVAAGIYVEDPVITKAITLLGPNATINPNTGARVGEAIILPAFSAPNPSTCEVMTYIEVSGVTIKGFTFDGDNPDLNSGVMIGAADVDACEIIASYEGVGNIVIENNILKHATYSGIDMYNYTNPAATAGNYIQNNLIQNIGEATYNWGLGILLYNNFYADVTGNVMEGVRVGIQTGNYYFANPGTTGSISNNVINAWRLGIFHNLWYSAASNIPVSGNTINAVSYPGYSTKWNGILVSSFGGAANTTVSNNIITIPDTLTFTEYSAGYNIWNDNTTLPLVISGGTVTGGDYGVFVNNWEGYISDANNTFVTIDGVTITGAEIGVYVKDSPSNTNGATVSAVLTDNVITATTGIKVEGADATATGNHNKVFATTTDIENTNPVSMNFEYNYWGSPCGPDVVIGVVDVSPWYTDAAMTMTNTVAASYHFAAGSTAATMNPFVACAANGSTFIFDGNTSGGIVVPETKSNLTFQLNGKTVGAGSPAFTISGDNIMIMGPGVLSGNGTDPGILVNAGADNFILDGVQVTGWSDGVRVAGLVTSLKIVNNWIHTNTDDGLQVDTAPLGIVTIEGNLFKVNGGVGVEFNGTGSLDATYNSWGAFGGPTGLGTNVVYKPWTFSEIFFDLDPVTTEEEVERHIHQTETFTVALKADAVKLNGLSFKFLYDPAKLVLASTTFVSPWNGKCTALPSLPTGQIGYFCAQAAGYEWTADGGTIATFTFTANISGDSFFDVFTDSSLTSGAVGGVKVFVNNAGYNAPSTGRDLLTDTNDGKLIIDVLGQFTGFIDLQGRAVDSGAVLDVWSAATGGTRLATATSASSGAYTTVFVDSQWMVVSTVDPAYSVKYWLYADRALYLPTFSRLQRELTSSLTTLPTLVLLGGDGTDNNLIDIADASCIGSSYGTSSNTCSGGAGANSDVTGDGIVNIYDLTLMGGNFLLIVSPWY